jgi:hypothetical protein
LADFLATSQSISLKEANLKAMVSKNQSHYTANPSKSPQIN